MTLVFSVSQAILCSLAGATYVSPFVGRLDDNGHDGIGLIRDIAKVFCHNRTDTKKYWLQALEMQQQLVEHSQQEHIFAPYRRRYSTICTNMC